MDRFHKSVYFLSLLFCSYNVLLIFETRCVGQRVSFSTKSDEIILVGSNITLICSMSAATPNDNVTMVMTDEIGKEVPFFKSSDKTQYTQESIFVNVTTNRTFFCNVTWMDFQATVNLSISPLPKEPTYCFTNYTDGIFIGQTITSTCYSSQTRPFDWNQSESDMVSPYKFIRPLIFSKTINTQPPLNKNGSVLICARESAQNDQDRCSVGPFYIYDELIVSINPVFENSPFVLYPGETNQYICSSFPSSYLEWITQDAMEASGIELSVVGSIINVTVPSDNTFTGDVDLECVGRVLNHTSANAITLTITSGTETRGPQPSVNDQGLHRVLSIALFVAIGCALIVIVVLIILILFSWTPKREKVSQTEVSDAQLNGDLKTPGEKVKGGVTLEDVYTDVHIDRSMETCTVKYANFNGKKVVDTKEPKKSRLEKKASVTYTTVNKFRDTIVDSDDFDDDFDDDAYWEY